MAGAADQFLAGVLGGFKPTNLPASQIQQESGGQQKDKNGQTLVGHYRDGSMPAPAQRAYGVAQIQVGTARETAQKHGIPWDENKLMNDRDYNLRLGDLHQGDLNQYYKGDTVKAKAAYHSGIGNVDRAIRQHGDNWAQGLGPHGRDYIGQGGGGVAGASGTVFQAPPIPGVLRDQGSTTLPSGNGPATIKNPFDTASLPADLQTSDNRARAADTMLQNVIEQTSLLQGDRKQALEDRNNAVEAISSEQRDQTANLLEKVKPLFQQKQAIADRMTEVTTMNPLKRGFMSLFDASYDRKHLAEVGGAIDNQLSVAGNEYKTMLDAQSTLLQVVNHNFEGDDAEATLNQSFLTQNLDLASQSFAASDLIVNQTLKGVGAQSQVLAAQNQLKDTVITGLTPGQRATALEQIKANKGQPITINGAQFTEGDMLAASQNDAQQQVRLDEMVISRETAAMNRSATAQRMADDAEDRLIQGMTTAQQRLAIQNGGEYMGKKLNLAKLGEGLQRSTQRDAQFVEGSTMAGALGGWRDSVKATANSMALAGQRIKGLTGEQPPAMKALAGQISREVYDMGNQLNAEKDPSRQQMLAAKFQPRIAQLYKQQQDQITTEANRWAGGNKKLLPLAQSYLTGSSLSSAPAVQGLIELARTGGSFGKGMSPAANAALEATKQVLAQSSQSQGGVSIESLMSDASPKGKAKQEALEAAVAAKVGEVYLNSTFDSMVKNAPAIAKQIGHIGQNLNGDILNNAIQNGDDAGFAAIGAQIGGLNADETRALFAGDKAATQKADLKGKSVAQWQSALSVAQLQSTYKILDATHPKIQGHNAGAVYANLLGNQKFATTAGALSTAQGQGSFGDSVIGTVGQGNLTANVNGYGQMALKAYSGMQHQALMKRVAVQNSYGNDPNVRMAAVLGATPDITADERRMLLQHFKQVPTAPSRYVGSIGPEGDNQERFKQLRTILLDTKFQDPKLERIRSKAARNFDAVAKQADDAVAAMSEHE